MADSMCPVCGCEQFYVKDPEDEYETFGFECRDGRVCFEGGISEDQCPEISDNTEVFCNACAWHDRFFKTRQ